MLAEGFRVWEVGSGLVGTPQPRALGTTSTSNPTLLQPLGPGEDPCASHCAPNPQNPKPQTNPQNPKPLKPQTPKPPKRIL